MATRPDGDLYSDDSGQDDLGAESGVTSPTDGYFQPTADDSLPLATEDSGGSRAPSHAVPHIPDVLVEDPTLSQPSNAKATEALRDSQQHAVNSEERLAESGPDAHRRPQQDVDDSPRRASGELAVSLDASNTEPYAVISQTPARPASQSTSPTAATRYAPSAQSLPRHPIDAPPAYSPARPRSYGTVETSIPETTSPTSAEETPLDSNESEPLLSSRTVSVHNAAEAGSTQAMNKSLPSTQPRLYLCLIIFITAMISGVITAVAILLPTVSKAGSIDLEPISEPEVEQPLVWQPPSHWKCRDTPHRIGETMYSLSLSRESVLNIVEEGWNSDSSAGGAVVKTFGDVVVRRSRVVASAEITFDGFSNDPSIQPRVGISSGHFTQTYKLTGPPRLGDWPDDGSSPCYQGRITVWLPAGTAYRSTTIAADDFNVIFSEGLNISVTDEFVVATDSGSIVAPRIKDIGEGSMVPYRLQSPHTFLVSQLTDIRGWFPIYNRLTLGTGPGDISVEVGLKLPMLSEHLTAELAVATRRGNVNLMAMPPQRDRRGRRDGKIPLRDYATVVHTTTGNITAKLAVGSRTEFETSSGNTDVDLQPVLGLAAPTQDRFPLLHTLSESGNAKIRVREPIWTDAIRPLESEKITARSGASGNDIHSERHSATQEAMQKQRALDNFQTEHITNGGRLLITYPDSWTGFIKWQGSDMRKVSLIATGVTILRQWGYLVKHIEARRGTGRSLANIDSQGGELIMAIGQEIGEDDTAPSTS